MNFFVDTGQRDAEKLKIKTSLVIEISRAIHKLGLTQEDAGQRLGIPEPKVSAILRGDFFNFSGWELIECLNCLGYDVEIIVRPAMNPVGRLTLVIV